MADFLHKKKDSSVWYYRRRYPQDVAQMLRSQVYMQSLKTAVKRDAARLSRQVSVEFDTICREARLRHDAVRALGEASEGGEAKEIGANAEAVIAEIPQLIRLAAVRVVEEQQRNPRGWQEVVSRWQSFYEAMKAGAVPAEAQRPAMVAQALLNGIELAVQGKPFPSDHTVPSSPPATHADASSHSGESWSVLCRRALKVYGEKVGTSRYRLAESKLPQVNVLSTAEHHVHEGLKAWCAERLKEVQPRTVKSQLDCMVSALRCVIPKLQTPFLRELKGVMAARGGDRQSMPVQDIRNTLEAFNARPARKKVRSDYEGGASQFDDIAIETLAVLGMRPRELVQAKTNALVTKTDVFGREGLFFRVSNGKNKASERDIPLSDGSREVVNISRLREMLAWQEENPRTPHGAVSSLSTRFRAMTKKHTLYQMRHTWKDVAVHAGIDFELRELVLGHRVKGVAAVYGSGIPLREGLDAIDAVRSEIFGTSTDTDGVPASCA